MMLKKKTLIFLIAIGFFFYEAIQMAYLNSIGASVQSSLHINDVDLSFISSIYYYAAAITLIPAGIILDRYDIKKVLLTTILISVSASFLFSLSKSYYLCLVYRAIAGSSGGAFSFIGGIQVARRLFKDRFLSFAIGILIATGMIGGIIAQTPFLILTKLLGWREVVFVFSFFGLIVLLLNIFALSHTNSKAKPYSTENNFLFCLISVLKNKWTWVAGFYICLMDSMVNIYGTLWGIRYLHSVKKVSPLHSSYITSVLFVGIIISSPLIGWLSDRFKLRNILLLTCPILGLLTLSLVIYSSLYSLSSLIICFFLLGFFSGSQAIGYSLLLKSNHPSTTSSASSIASILVIGVGAILKQVYAAFINQKSNFFVLTSSNNPYSLSNMLIIAALFISFILAVIILCKRTDNLETP